MVDHFENCEFWLPSDFLTEEDFDLNLKQSSGSQEEKAKKNVSDCGSEMGSPGESVVSSTESESDDDEFITGLTRQMEYSSIEENTKAWKLSSSPKSPLCNASGEFAKRKTVKKSASVLQSRNEVFESTNQQPNVHFPTNPPPQLAYQELQAVRFEQFRRHQMMIQAQQNIGLKNDERKPMGFPVLVWPPLQRFQPKPQPGTSMRAVFLGNNSVGVRKQCAGTGVFLPRTPSSSGNHKNKPSCSPVLIPHRVVQALNLSMETLGVHNQAHYHPGYYNNNGFCADYGAASKHNNDIKKNHVKAQQIQSIARAEPENPEVIRLPQEWTY